ncbi:MAG: nicotinamide mononucleotide transporter [Gammaproteobacteria bacterium]|mgnify:CR=1 FL=1|jgi:nicotinamide mononucleotide transporter|nr:nicotinamide mononucleotide transporter [Gammaproteobacteria bacterium]MBT4494379.1 nicotinamide mononucleotide transporter [Gammaproteobacteria bacterium]MBT7369619.1 nicotinamide mononucleotide transporter [Gammaproteobacteria bacterium]
MTDLLTVFLDEFRQNTLLELTAVILAIAYLLLAVRQKLSCWYAAFVSTAIFLYVFWQVNLYMESALQVYYLAMAIYGWWSWKNSGGESTKLSITTWRPGTHALAICFIITATFISGQLLADTDQRLAYLDSFTTWGAVVTTFMVTRKILENWIYWLVIDSASIYLYLDRELYFTSLLFVAYIVIVFFGLHTWLRDYRSAFK